VPIRNVKPPTVMTAPGSPHPGLVALAKEVFDRHMPKANQIERKLADFNCTAADCLARLKAKSPKRE